MRRVKLFQQKQSGKWQDCSQENRPMDALFLAARCDEDSLTKELRQLGCRRQKIIYDKAVEIEKISASGLIVVISPVSADSSVFQAAVLDTLSSARIENVFRLRLDSADIPIGFGKLCDVPDWRGP